MIRTPTFGALLAAVVSVATPAAAMTAEQTALETVARPTPVAAHGPLVVWNAYDAAAQRYRLRIGGEGRAPRDLPVPAATESMDVDLGPGPDGGTALVFSVCDGGDCDLHWLEDLVAGTPRPVPSAATPGRSETSPSIDGGTVAFVSRARGDAYPAVRTTRLDAKGTPRSLRPVPRSARRPNGTVMKTDGAALDGVELRDGRVLAVWTATPRGREGRYTQVLYAPSRRAGWRGLARASSGLLSSAQFLAPAFVPGRRALFGFSRAGQSVAPRLVTVRLEGRGRAREAALDGATNWPLAVDAAGDDRRDVALVSRQGEAGECDTAFDGRPRARCLVSLLEAPSFRPAADPAGYSVR